MRKKILADIKAILMPLSLTSSRKIFNQMVGFVKYYHGNNLLISVTFVKVIIRVTCT